MAMAAPPQRIVTSPCGGIVLNGDARPVMDGVLQPFVAGKATDHEALFAATRVTGAVPAKARKAW